MKKNKILKLFLTFICLIAIPFIGNNVYGYKMEYKAFCNHDTNNTETNGFVRIRTMGNTFRGSGPTSEFSKVKFDSFFKIEEEAKKENDVYPFSYRYQTKELILHNETLSNYNNTTKSSSKNNPEEWVFTMGYDYGFISFDNENKLTDSIKQNIGYVSKKDTSKIEQEKLELDGKYFKAYKERFVLAGDKLNTTQTITITDWLVDESIMRKIFNSKPDLILDSEGKHYTYISLDAVTNGPSSLETQLRGKEINDSFRKYSYYEMNTAFEAMKIVYQGYYWAPNRGIVSGESPYIDNVKSSMLAKKGQTIMNLYDNQLIIPTELTTPQEVYIRHVDKDGNLLNISNDSEIKISSDNTKSVINNSGEKTIKRSDKTEVKYQEYYKIYLGEKLQVSRSLTMASNGKMYKYKNAIVSSAKTATDAANNDDINKNSNKKTDSAFEVGGNSDDKAVTVVTFVYDEADVPGYPPTDDNNDPPTGDIHTEFSSDDNSGKCIQKYTPTKQNIKPYLNANRILLKDLKYKLEKNGDNVVYKIDNFNVQQLVGGKIEDNSDASPEGTGTIFGNENYTLFNSDTSSNFIVTDNSKEVSLNYANAFKNSNNNGSLPSQATIDSFVKNENNKSSFNDFDRDENNKFIPEKKYNGLRSPKLSANYQAINVMNGGGLTSGSIGYRDVKNKVNIIVYNPLDLDTIKVTSKEIIDHTTSSSSEQNVIQKNADFTVSFGTKGSSQYTQITDTSSYLDYYYLIFDIDVVLKSNYQVRKRTDTGFTDLQTISSGSKVEAGSLIKINKEDKEFNAIASSNKSGKDIVSQVQNNVILIGVTNNMPSEALENLVFSNAVKKYVVKNDTIEEKYINTTISTNRINFANYCDTEFENIHYHEKQYTSNHDMYSDSYYFAMARAETTNVGRIYDFKVTDCSDIDYKSVFRKTSTTNKVNELTGVQYFSGVKSFNIYTNEINSLEDRGEINISGSSAKKILPLGPYKNTNTSYVNAPKMGYRISFDLKTSGFFDGKGGYTREVLIQPSYYYISKDGTNFDNSINLYYKNSDGKYEKFSGSDYTIYFKPKDGYRSVANSITAGNISGMSAQLEPLAVGSTSGFKLNSKMMSTADNKFIQAWYGEFKLPNSTIAVKGSDVSSPYTNGYIGVVFNITSIDKDSNNKVIREISYNQNNNNAAEDKRENTTQWDYEGYLGFTNYGNKVDSITLQLEKGDWKIDNSRYQDIKGTVVLYDTDNRASNDFD